MDQEKIGKFIAKQRKAKKLTQEELATKLKINNKSISRWENGKCMPDLSLLIPLSKELDVSLNDLLSGEKIDNKKYKEEFEKNVVNIVSDVTKNNKRFAILFLLVFNVLLIIGLIYFNRVHYHQAPIINLTTLRTKRKANNFYKYLKSDDFEQAGKILTNYHQDDI